MAGDPDTYSNHVIFIITNLLSMCGFMMFFSVPFVFMEPKIECHKFEEGRELSFRCSATQACTYYRDSFVLEQESLFYSFISQYNVLCEATNYDSKQIFSILSGIIILSQLLTGYLMDKVGRKLIIVVKASLSLVSLLPLIAIGFIPSVPVNVVFALYFLGLLTSTYTFDLIIHGFECLSKQSRDNFVVTVAASRAIGIAIVGIIFYLTNRWVYFMIA